jgi:hypothetical protein
VPVEGAFRVHPNPFDMPSGPWLAGGGPNRYDDPAGQYGVLYLGGTLACCLKEVFDRSRRSDEFEARAEEFEAGRSSGGFALDEDDDDLDLYGMPPGPDPTLDDYSGWLPRLQMARIAVPQQEQLPVVDHDDVLGDLDRHHLVRAVLDDLQVKHVLGSRLTRVLVRGKDRLVYRVTQAISAAIHSHEGAFGGVAYDSCVDPAEGCWGVYDRTSIIPESAATPLLGPGGEIPAVMMSAAAFVGITLPPVIV